MEVSIVKIISATVAVLASCSATSEAVEIHLRERAVMSGSVVRLADVAVVASDDAPPRLAALPLMPAPAPGTQRFLQRREIADLLAAHGVDLQSVKFKGAGQVAISSKDDGWKGSKSAARTAPVAGMNRHAAILAGQVGEVCAPEIDPSQSKELRDEISYLITTYLNAKTSDAAAWRVRCQLSDRQLAQLAAAISTPSVQGGNAPWTGRQRFVVEFSTSEGAVQLPIYAEVTATSKPVIVAVRPVSRGEVFTAANLELRAVDFLPKASDRRAPLESIEELIGMEARQAIRAGDVVFNDQVQAPVLIKRGEVINISSHGGGIRVRTTARARQDGARGEVVQVESLDTRERFDARVVGPREAAVFAQTRVETARRSTTRK